MNINKKYSVVISALLIITINSCALGNVRELVNTANVSAMSDTHGVFSEHKSENKNGEAKRLLQDITRNSFRLINIIGKGTYTFGRVVECGMASRSVLWCAWYALTPTNPFLQNRLINIFGAFRGVSIALAMYRSLRNGDKESVSETATTDGNCSDINMVARTATLMQKIRQSLSTADRKTCMRLMYATGRGIGVYCVLGGLYKSVQNAIKGNIDQDALDCLASYKKWASSQEGELGEAFREVMDMIPSDKTLFRIGVGAYVSLSAIPILVALCKSLKNGDEGFEGTAVSELWAGGCEKTASQTTADKQENKATQCV